MVLGWSGLTEGRYWGGVGNRGVVLRWSGIGGVVQ